MKNKIALGVYSSNGEFQGYLLHISMTKAKIETTPDKYYARSFSTMNAASKVAEKIENMTKGCLRCSIA